MPEEVWVQLGLDGGVVEALHRVSEVRGRGQLAVVLLLLLGLGQLHPGVVEHLGAHQVAALADAQQLGRRVLTVGVRGHVPQLGRARQRLRAVQPVSHRGVIEWFIGPCHSTI